MSTAHNKSAADRARAYAMKFPTAIQGEGGCHNLTFNLACKLTRGFDLGVEGAMPIFREWNAGCQPPWTEAELLHKLQEADRLCKEARGYMLDRSIRFSTRANCSTRSVPAQVPAAITQKPNRSGFRPGTELQLQALAHSRPYHFEGLKLVQERGMLVFGTRFDMACYGITDLSGLVLELRRIDGQVFPKIGDLDERKSHSIRHSRKKWPVGMMEASRHHGILLVEGIPDFLEAHHLVWNEGRQDSVGVVAMLSANPAIADDALPFFRGKHVRIIPHLDQNGIRGACKWQNQLRNSGATTVDFVDLARLSNPSETPIVDLYDAVHTSSNFPQIAP